MAYKSSMSLGSSHLKPLFLYWHSELAKLVTEIGNFLDKNNPKHKNGE